MSTLPLRAHPATPCSWIDAATVAVERQSADVLACRFELQGDIERLRIPQAAAAAVRTDGLWRHTCFELFLRAPHGTGYTEFNFSPSGDWAAYQFDRYRHGMRQLATEAPVIAFAQGAGSCVLTAQVTVPGPAAGPMQAGVAVVLEDQEGGICYWAMRHPQGAPDFHHEATFAAEV